MDFIFFNISDLTIKEILYTINPISIFFRLGMALLFGGLIGIERESKKRPAGFRTYMLVCIGAALTMITNQYVYQEIDSSVDLVRMGAQVISGIGFLGAGTVIVGNTGKVKGLTTAASLWASGCMGLAIGMGFYSGAIIAFFYIFMATTILHRVNQWITKNSMTVSVYVEFETLDSLSKFIEYSKEQNFYVSDFETTNVRYSQNIGVAVFVTLKSNIKRTHTEMLMLLSKAEGIKYIDEI